MRVDTSMYARTDEKTGQDLQEGAWVAGQGKTARDVRQACVLLSCPTHQLMNYAQLDRSRRCSMRNVTT